MAMAAASAPRVPRPGRAKKHIAKARGSRDLGDSDRDGREHERGGAVFLQSAGALRVCPVHSTETGYRTAGPCCLATFRRPPWVGTPRRRGRVTKAGR
jgi:hypothetical protein